jgi:hypothetical protein
MTRYQDWCPACEHPAIIKRTNVRVEESETPFPGLVGVACSNAECTNYVDPSRLG